METRKLIKFGGSSHIISIPNNWIKKNSLNKGDLIYIKENGNNELILHPSLKEEKRVEKVIKINADKKLGEIKRDIISAYINNYGVFEISGKNLKKYNEKIENLINRNLVAVEIVEGNSKMIIARDFLDMKNVSLNNLIRRMDTTVRVMTEKVFEEDKKLAYQEIKDMDHGVNKLRFLLFKIIKSGMEDHNLARELKVSNYQLLKTWLTVSYLEEIADEIRRFMRFRKNLKLNNKDRSKLRSLFSDIKDSYINIMEAFYQEDKAKAHEVSGQRDDHMKRCDAIFENSKNKDLIPLVEKMKAMESWIRNISRVILDG